MFPQLTQCDVLTSYIRFLKYLLSVEVVFQINTRMQTHAHYTCQSETLLPQTSVKGWFMFNLHVHSQAVLGGGVQRQTFGAVGHQDRDTSPGNG